MKNDKAREELMWGWGWVTVGPGLTGVRVKLYWLQGAGLGTTAGCMCSPLHVAHLWKLKKVSHSSMLLQVSGSPEGWEAARSSRQLPTFATTFGGVAI